MITPSRMKRLASLLIATLPLSCSPHERVALVLPEDFLAGAGSIIVIEQDSDSFLHKELAPADRFQEAMPKDDPKYDGEPRVLTALAYAGTPDDLRLSPGTLAPSNAGVDRTIGLVHTDTQPSLPEPTSSAVFQFSGDGVEGPSALGEASPRLKSMRFDPLPGPCDQPEANPLFIGDLASLEAYYSVQIDARGVLFLGGDRGIPRPTCDSPAEPQYRRYAIIATLDLSKLDPNRPASTISPKVVDFPDRFTTVKGLILTPRGELFGYATVTSTVATIPPAFFRADSEGVPTELWPSPFQPSDFEVQNLPTWQELELANLANGSVLGFTPRRMFEIDPQTTETIDRTAEYPPDLRALGDDGQREYALTVPRLSETPTFGGATVLSRLHGGDWEVELEHTSPVSESDRWPVASLAVGASRVVMSANSQIYLREAFRVWSATDLGKPTVAKSDVAIIAHDRALVLGFSGFSAISDLRKGWCTIPTTGSARSVNELVVDPSGRYAAGIDFANACRRIATWVGLFSFR